MMRLGFVGVCFILSFTCLGAQSALAQANVRPDGGIEVKGQQGNPDEVNYPKGDPSLQGLRFTKSGNSVVQVKSFPTNCTDPQLTNSSDSHSECRREPGDGLWKYVVHSTKITCSNSPRERRIITSFEKTATPCTEEDYESDAKAAEQTFGEKWEIPKKSSQIKNTGAHKKKAKKKKGAPKKPAASVPSFSEHDRHQP